MKEKFTSTIAGASIFISLMGILSRGLGFIREMIFANNFGLETEFDLYLVGAVLPITINSIILYLGQNYFVPGFQKINANDNDAAQKFYKQSFTLFLGIGIVVSLILFLLSDFIIDAYMQQAQIESKAIASIVFRIFILTIPFSAAISIFSAFLQAIYEFKYPAISILFLNVSVIILLIFFSEQFGVFIIPVGFLLGTILQFIYLLSKSQKIMPLKMFSKEKLKIPLTISGSSLMIIVIIEALSQLYSLFDRYFYSDISQGGIAALNYALIIWFLPVSIFSMSLATAVFPKISNAINDNSIEKIEGIYNESISMNIFLFLPVAFILYFYGDVIIKLFFERGKFVSESTAITFSVLKFYSISLVFYSIYAVFNKIFYSINKIKSLLLITIIGVFLKLLLNIFLLSMQQDGLALSTSASYIFFFFASFFVLNSNLKIKNRSLFVKEIFFHGANCGLSILVTEIIVNHMFTKGILNDLLSITLFVIIYIFNTSLIAHNSMNLTIKILGKMNLFAFSKTN